MNYGIYVSYADVKAARGLDDSEHNTLLRTYCRAASLAWDRHTKRRFWPLVATRHYDYPGPWRLRLDDDLLEVTTLTNGDGETLTESTHYYLYPLSEYPKWRIDIRRDVREVFQYKSTAQRQISVAGIWGFHDDWGNAWADSGDAVADAGGVNASATSITVTDVDGADAWGLQPRFKADTLVKIDSEYLWVTATNTTANAITVVRGVNGSTAAAHDAGAGIYTYQPPQDVVHAITRWVMYMYDQKDTGVYETTAMPGAGVIQVPQGIPKDVRLAMEGYTRRRVG